MKDQLMNRIIIISVLVAAGIILAMLPIFSEQYASTSMLSMFVTRTFDDQSSSQGKFVPISNQTLANLPTLKNAMIEADKLQERLLTLCKGNCAANLAGPMPRTTYGTQISLNEASLAITTIAFKDVVNPSTGIKESHATGVEYDGKYYTVVITTSKPQHVPPPMPLTAWGPQVSSFDQAKSITGLLTASLPSYVPAELKIESIRASGNHIGVDFIPNNMTARDDDTLEKVMGGGGVIIIYAQEPPTFNQTTWIQNFVNQMTQEHHMDKINGHPSIIVNADKSAVFMLYTDEMVDIESMKYNSSELKKMAQSMLS